MEMRLPVGMQKLSQDTHKWTDTFMGDIIERVFPRSRWKTVFLWRKCLSHVPRDLECCHLLYIRELQLQASGKRQQPRSHFAAHCRDLHPDYTISNKPEYCILFSRVFRSSGFSNARAQWNVRIKCMFCWKICTGISVNETELLYHRKE